MSSNQNQPGTKFTTKEHRRQRTSTAGQQPQCRIQTSDTFKTDNCRDLEQLMEKVSILEKWWINRETDFKRILNLFSELKTLMILSIGCGGLSILFLIALLVSVLERSF